MPGQRLLLCTDMDRTVIPNGLQAEAPGARKRLAAFCARKEVVLAYVTGRYPRLVRDAVREYGLPEPCFAVTDVGTRMYRLENSTWKPIDAWTKRLDEAWHGITAQRIEHLLRDIGELRLQEPDKRNRHKASYYAPFDMDPDTLLALVRSRLSREAIETNLVWSVDEETEIGLLDVLPPCADKGHAVEFLRQHIAYNRDEIVFAGDSGNDLAVLEQGRIPFVLVANASPAVKQRARKLAADRDCMPMLHIAAGNGHANGYYADGVLEGVRHFMTTL